MRNLIVILFIVSVFTVKGQIAQHNSFPTMQPSHILDDKLENISFAYSLRIVESDYNGPLIRLRRSSDNSEQDFFHSDNDIVDIAAINTWRGTDNVFVHTWYDQSGLGRNAIQTVTNQQPRFYPNNPSHPYFQGDGSNDALVVDTPLGIRELTNNGDQGTVLSIMNVTRRNQTSWGSATGGSRWFVHANWGNNAIYFDPGDCCNNPRAFNNAANVGVFKHYSFIKTDTNVIMRESGIERVNGTFTLNRFTGNAAFGICAASNQNNTFSHSTTSFMELIMYSTNVTPTIYQEIEDNAIIFWNL